MAKLATMEGKDAALAALAERRAHSPKQVDNAALPADSPIYFYCISCGHLSDIKPESYLDIPKKLCDECKALQDLGWLS